MMRIFKYEVGEATGNREIKIEMPSGSRFLAFDFQEIHYEQGKVNKFCIWAEVDEQAPKVVEKFAILATGSYATPGFSYRGTKIIGGFVWHLYQKTK